MIEIVRLLIVVQLLGFQPKEKCYSYLVKDVTNTIKEQKIVKVDSLHVTVITETYFYIPKFKTCTSKQFAVGDTIKEYDFFSGDMMVLMGTCLAADTIYYK